MSNENFISYLREESRDLKNCFTQFSFQAITFCSIALGVLTKYQTNHPYLGYSGILIVFITLSVGRIGIYKYSNSNRINGYELFLDRIKILENDKNWDKDYKKIGWEEALRAWRSVQPTIFQYYYEVGHGKINILKYEHNNLKYKWFEPKTLHKKGTVYYTGSYLKTMLSILNITAILGIVAMLVMILQFYQEKSYYHLCFSILSTLIVIVTFFKKSKQLKQRRILLQEGILSIHSCAIMWQLVVIAHHKAIEMLSIKNKNTQIICSLHGYTENLSLVTLDLREHLKKEGASPHNWNPKIETLNK